MKQQDRIKIPTKENVKVLSGYVLFGSGERQRYTHYIYIYFLILTCSNHSNLVQELYSWKHTAPIQADLYPWSSGLEFHNAWTYDCETMMSRWPGSSAGARDVYLVRLGFGDQAPFNFTGSVRDVYVNQHVSLCINAQVQIQMCMHLCKHRYVHVVVSRNICDCSIKRVVTVAQCLPPNGCWEFYALSMFCQATFSRSRPGGVGQVYTTSSAGNSVHWQCASKQSQKLELEVFGELYTPLPAESVCWHPCLAALSG